MRLGITIRWLKADSAWRPEDRISWGLLAGFLVFLPFYRFYSELLLVFFCLHTLLHLRKRPFADVSIGRMLLLQSAFLLSLVSMAWTHYPDDGWSKVGRQMAIFLFPLLFCLTRLDLARHRESLLRLFALACTATVSYLFFDAFKVIHGLHLPWKALSSPAFANQQFSEPIHLHPTCLSLYAALSLLYLLLRRPQALPAAPRPRGANSWLWRAPCCLILLAGLIQLEAKSVLIGCCLCLFFVVPFDLRNHAARLRYWLASAAVAGLLVVGLSRDSYFRSRLVDGLARDLTATPTATTNLESRMDRWRIAAGLIRQAPLAGFGTGAEVHLLDSQYFNHRMYRSYLVHLNAHNQYLSMALDSGLGGTLLFVMTLLAGGLYALRRRDFLFLSFLTLIGCTACSEDLLDINKGIFFYAFFFSLFTYGRLTA